MECFSIPRVISFPHSKSLGILGRMGIALCFLAALAWHPQAGGMAQNTCFTLPDLDTHAVSGVINSYYPGTATAAAGATSISLGPGRGAGDSIQIGDLLLVIHIQDALINASNDANYGSGSGSGNGYTIPNNAGRYEYVVAASSLDFASGGAVSITGAGAGGGLLNAYTHASASSSSGQRRFQVVRVPAYLNAALAGTVTASPWDGSTGGVVVLETVNALDFNGNSIDVDGLGFRGGGGRQLNGASGRGNWEYRTLYTATTNSSKGEGIAGTPRYVYYLGADGYPNGSHARGAPGNAGGGGADGQPSANDQNSGGGGGGAIFLSGAPSAIDVSGGVNGTTTNVYDAYGAAPGAVGVIRMFL